MSFKNNEGKIGCSNKDLNKKETLESNISHYKKMLEGLREDMKALEVLNNRGYRYNQSHIREMVGACYIEIDSYRSDLKAAKRELKELKKGKE